MRLLTCALAFFALVVSASAQTESPVAVHYRDYAAALQRGDLPGAEISAELALAASEQRDGDGGRTAILALNLARVRIQQLKWSEAAVPANRAYTLSHAHSDTGVDPVMSELLLDRVRLALEGFHGAGPLSDLLARSSSRADLVGDRYDAAEDLGVWAAQTNNHIIARRAWAFAADAAEGAPFEASLARGRARAYEAIAIAMQSLSRNVFMSATTARQVRERLSEAHALIRPAAFAPSPDGYLSTTQAVYAQILGWDSAIWSTVASADTTRADDDRLDPNPASIDGIPVCEIRRVDGGALTYPAQQWRQGQLGAVVVRLRFDDHGGYLGSDVAAYVGDVDFQHAVAASAATWRYEAVLHEGCRPGAIFYLPIAFYMQY